MNSIIPKNYFYIRDFEYAQLIYDFAFLLEVKEASNDKLASKFRIKSLLKAALSLDGYTCTYSKWLNSEISDDALDYIPSLRIKNYLNEIVQTGTIKEYDKIKFKNYEICLQLRSIGNVGKKKVIDVVKKLKRKKSETELSNIAIKNNINPQIFKSIRQGEHFGTWQKSHFVVPIFRFMHCLEGIENQISEYELTGINPLTELISTPIEVRITSKEINISSLIKKVCKDNPLFSYKNDDGKIKVIHKMGWHFLLSISSKKGKNLSYWVNKLDPLTLGIPSKILSDLHMHSTWSDGGATIEQLLEDSMKRKLKHIAITEHSRTLKLQSGLTSFLWIRQKDYINKIKGKNHILHGLEVDILEDGSLDMPEGFLKGVDLVIGSIHSHFNKGFYENTRRINTAIQSGCIDILGHPTNAILGKPGVPNYKREPIEFDWDSVIKFCAKWQVALEINCFPSRIDEVKYFLEKGIEQGCWFSLGSDAHSRKHLEHIRYGIERISKWKNINLLNHLSIIELISWVSSSRVKRQGIKKVPQVEEQLSIFAETKTSEEVDHTLTASYAKSATLPKGSKVVGLDITAGLNKKTGAALLDGNNVTTCSLLSNDDIYDYIEHCSPSIVSIDSPLGLPGGQKEIVPEAGIVREAEKELASIGIPAYPALIDSMKELTLRGIKLKNEISKKFPSIEVIESYPGAAQDILGIPRKQSGLEFLKNGLRNLGIVGNGLDSDSHDEIDAITCCIVGRYYEAGQYYPMGIKSEAQLIVPYHPLLRFKSINPVICLAGASGSGKSIVARYLAVFYGFKWLKSREIILRLMQEDFDNITTKRLEKEPSSTFDESDIKNFGTIILKEYNQIPLKNKLHDVINEINEPIILDSIRSTNDVEKDLLHDKFVAKWFVDCSDSMIQSNLLKRDSSKTKLKRKYNQIDSKILDIKSCSDVILKNKESLESLHRQIDDALFKNVIQLKPTEIKR